MIAVCILHHQLLQTNHDSGIYPIKIFGGLSLTFIKVLYTFLLERKF